MCGVGLIRLRKPLSDYETPLQGLQWVSLLMQKQRNRGQDGAGILCHKGEVPPGQPYWHTRKWLEPTPAWQHLLDSLWKSVQDLSPAQQMQHPFVGPLYLVHLRYGTYGRNTEAELHPMVRQSGWATRSLALAGNFNFTNVAELFERLLALGQKPMSASDTYIILERMGHFLDQMVEGLYREAKSLGLSKTAATAHIRKKWDLADFLGRAARRWDGGYALVGVLGTGEAFAMRDPWGIRPLYYYLSEDVVAVASEMASLQNVFQVPVSEIHEVPPAHVLIVDENVDLRPFAQKQKYASCIFERIYFSRGHALEIYQQRKALGAYVAEKVYASLGHDLQNAVFTYVPNTSQAAFVGLVEALRRYGHPRVEPLIHKDAAIRTFIASAQTRKNLSAFTYDLIYGILRPSQDILVCVDDSVVRGSTLRQALLPALARLEPQKILFVSCAPQIRYPDFYGIDMAWLGDLLAFQAVVALLREKGQEALLAHTYYACKEALPTPQFSERNFVQDLYAPFSEAEIAQKMAQLVRPPTLSCPVELLFQPLDNLPKIFPDTEGNWYFTGNYPTPGGYRSVNLAFIRFYEGKTTTRPYEELAYGGSAAV
ncbi:MAG: amidophosphoribosyltransferase [Bacteroidia bacterium]